MSKYFDQFPKIIYANSQCVNILARVGFSEILKNNYNIFYPYVMNDYERMDTLSYNYYGNSDFDWILYLTNDIIDPFYGVYLNDEDFQDFIISKYDSIPNASINYVFYRNNWIADDSVITAGAYDSLDASVKKYYDPILISDNNINGYQRKKANWIFNTNQILQLSIQTPQEFAAFESGDNITLEDSNGILSYEEIKNFVVGERLFSSVNGFAFVSWSNTTSLQIQHINGSFPANGNFTITGEISGAISNVNSVSIVTNTIPELEQIFYSPISYYEYEVELNEAKKNIDVLNTNYLQDVYRQFKQLMKS